MNPSDSKKLEIEKRLEEWNIAYTDYRPFKKERVDDVLMEDAEPDVIRLISRLKEQDQEIAGLRLDGWVDLSARIAEQDREIERRLDRSVQLMAEKHYQRRHREWALKQCRTWQRFFCFYKDDAVRFHSDRADKAEARVAEVEDLRYQSFKETRKHCDKWQQDRKDLMQNIPGYQYKNRVDDPEWGKAKKILLSLLAEKEKV